MSFIVTVAVFVIVFAVVMLVGRMVLNGRETNPTLPANAFGTMTEALSAVIPHSGGKKKRIQTELSDAGLHHRNALINFLSLRNVALMGWTLLSGSFLVFSDLRSFGNTTWYLFGAVAFGGLIGVFGLPRIVLTSIASGRKKKIENALPDALDMIAMSVEGGLPLEKSLSRVAHEIANTHVALAGELRIIARQASAGSFQTAIHKFGKRTSIADITAWAAIVRQNQQTGGDIVESLREYADRMRSNRRQRIEKASATASVKLLLPVVLFLAPPVFIVLIGPGILDFRDFILREQQSQAEVVSDANLPNIERLLTGSGQD